MDKNKITRKWKPSFNKKSLKVFFDKFGFYLILLVCVGIIATTAILTQGDRWEKLTGDNEDTPNQVVEGGKTGTDPSKDIDITITDVTVPEPTGEVTGETPTADPNSPVSNPNSGKTDPDQSASTGKDKDPKHQTTEPKDKDVPVSAAGESDKSVKVHLPADGEVLQPYEVDTLVFSQTLKEWTTHTGIDIAGNLGDEVRAALAGTVESIEEDELKGIVITLAHDKDVKTVYMGLSTKDMVREGQKVEKGQVISGIGRTAAFEIMEDPHLHFEVLQNGESQDPETFFNEK